MQKTALLEALLFSTGSSYRMGEIAKILEISVEEARGVVEALQRELSENTTTGARGIVVITNGDEVALGTHPDASAMLEGIRKVELTGPLTKQALETLAIIAYGDNAPKHLIDAIRGVNSQFTLRNLIERGLIERYTDPSDKRAFRYRITNDALAHLGISSVAELPEFSETKKILEGQYTSESSDRSANPASGPATEIS